MVSVNPLIKDRARAKASAGQKLKHSHLAVVAHTRHAGA